ncbi:MAG: hypothetical protein IJQ12_09400 [Lachnospiraceae bacterium]|nr:hypothetical protein [Lachnospiraceae bacterium]
MISLCDGWQFTAQWDDAFAAGKGTCGEVRLPHQVCELPLHYVHPSMYRAVCGYRRYLAVDKKHLAGRAGGQRLFLQFDGASHVATVGLNGKELLSHSDFDSSFRIEITDDVREGKDNLLTVRLDTYDPARTLKDGTASDYLSYGGLYREVWLDVRGSAYLQEIDVITRDNDTVCIETLTDDTRFRPSHVRLSICDADGKKVCEETSAYQTARESRSVSLTNAHLWDIRHPYLYTLNVELLDDALRPVDKVRRTFGIREMHFENGSFFLNRKKVFLRGLLRHQDYPYVGYAATARLQEEDVRILKQELKCNAVLVKDMPSRHFLRACDRLGMIVLADTGERVKGHHPSVIEGTGSCFTDAGVAARSFDPWERLEAQAMYHARALRDAVAAGTHAGCVLNCMHDYATRLAYGSGDHVSYRGVLDRFRNPKTLAALYASMEDDELTVSCACPMNAADTDAEGIGAFYCFTNADDVTVYRNDELLKRFAPDRKEWSGLKHPPVLVDITGEETKSDKPVSYQLIATKHGLTKEITKSPGTRLHLDVRVSHTKLCERDTYDMAAVRVRLTDEHGNCATYAQLPVRFTAGDGLLLCGEDVVCAEGGMCGTYVRTDRREGEATLTIAASGCTPVKIAFQITCSPDSGKEA